MSIPIKILSGIEAEHHCATQFIVVPNHKLGETIDGVVPRRTLKPHYLDEVDD